MRLTILGVLLRFIRSGIGERSIETRLKYIGGVDKIMRYEEGVEAFLGQGFHEAMEWRCCLGRAHGLESGKRLIFSGI